MNHKTVVFNEAKMNFDGNLDFSVLSSEVVTYSDTTPDQFLERVADAEILVTKEMPVSREQIAAILWRSAGSPSADGGQNFADESDISAYAGQAVDWARANGIVNGVNGNRFLPQSNTTRAQVAMILCNYLTMAAAEEPEQPTGAPRILVAYFSATGNTERVANTIAEVTGGDLFEITPADPYKEPLLSPSGSCNLSHCRHQDALHSSCRKQPSLVLPSPTPRVQD